LIWQGKTLQDLQYDQNFFVFLIQFIPNTVNSENK